MYTIYDVTSSFDKKLGDNFTHREKKQIIRLMLMHYFDCERADLILRESETVSDGIINAIERNIQDINNGKPFQYVMGFTNFYGLELKVDERALIPRPETEELVEWICRTWKNKHPKILDVGTGTGCIALALKDNMSGSEVVGVDLYKAIELAQENAKLLELDVTFKRADGLNLKGFSEDKWDVIVSNPPYIPLRDKLGMADHVVKHEPETALFVSDDDPLIFYREIGKYAKEHLSKEGNLFFEIHEGLGKEVVELMRSIGFSEVEIKKDLQNKDRMVKVAV